MEEPKELRTMRAMAWQRAKGELNSIMETFYSDYRDEEYKPKEFKSKFEHFKDLLDHFVDEVEGHELDK
jgi:hypothetical protein